MASIVKKVFVVVGDNFEIYLPSMSDVSILVDKLGLKIVYINIFTRDSKLYHVYHVQKF